MAIFALLGKLAWPVVGSVLPGFNPRLAVILASLMAALVVVGGPAGAVWLHMHGAKREAVRLANASCELRVAEGAAASAEALSGILVSIKEDEPAPRNKAEAASACKRSKLCRENGS